MNNKLNSKERLLKTLNHQNPDRIPIDLGGCISTTIHVKAYDNLKKHLGILSDTKIFETAFQLAEVEDSVLKELSIDTRPLIGNPSSQGHYINDDGKYIDEWGIKFKKNGDYYNIVEYPLENASIKDLKSYSWPDPYDNERVKGLQEKGEEISKTNYAIVGSPYGFTRIFEQAWQLRSMEKLLTDLIENKKFVHKLFEKILNIQKGIWDLYLKKAGNYVDVIRIGDDLAMQSGPIMSPKLYREMIKPYHKEYFKHIKENTNAQILYHCCGSIIDLIEDFIEIGVDIINPVQVSAKGMDTKLLKENYGDEIIFWGGIDNREILPKGTPGDVRKEVRKRIDHLSESGGYVLSAAHNIQPDVPPENILAMYDEAIKYSRTKFNK